MKLLLDFHSGSTEAKTLGDFKTYHAAAEAAMEYCSRESLTCPQDTVNSIEEALETRGFYYLAYGPRELVVEE